MEQDHIPNDDFVYCLADSPNFKKDGLVFAAKKTGLYRSTDKGNTWHDAFASLETSDRVPITAAVVAAAGEITYVFAGLKGQILYSPDVGQTWLGTVLDTPDPLIAALVVSPNFAQDGTLLAATVQDGIFRSTDRLRRWTGWSFGLYDSNINTLAFLDSQIVFAGTQSGIFRSSNAGRSWRDLDFPIDLAPVVCMAMSRDGTIHAGTEAEGLLVSCDEGKTWEQLIQGTVEQIHLDASGRLLILRDGELLLSENGGTSWQAARPGFERAADISALIAPLGLNAAKPLLVGLSNGEIIKL